MSTHAHRPRFNEARGLAAAIQLPPPFDFSGVTMRVFPLRARPYLVQAFVDRYVNMIPREAGYFRPFLPYVYMLVMNYGPMSVQAANLGWLSQHEVVFAVPVEWYRFDHGRYVFHDWACLSPFIYVDSELSMTTGRSVYGWAKSIAWLTQELSGWMESPRTPPRLATISTMVYPEIFAGQRQEPRVLLEMIHEPPVGVTTALKDSAMLGLDVLGVLRGTGLLRRHDGSSLSSYAEMLRKAAETVNLFQRDVQLNAVNLKQFRSAAHARNYCYQAVTTSKMEIRGYNDAGLLGAGAILRGDPSGGFRIRIHRYESHPVIDTLGIEVDSEWQGDGARVASLKPVFPFWIDVGMRYHLGETVAWRTGVTGWRDGTGRPLYTTPSNVAVFLRPNADRDHVAESKPQSTDLPEPLYNNANGMSLAASGPFDFPNTTLRVLPLLADHRRLQGFVDDFMNRPLAGLDGSERRLTAADRRFWVWGRYVYLVAASYEQMASTTNNVGWWADREINFYVPVKWYEVRRGKRRLQSVALIPAFSYANSTTAAITGAEVTGVPMLKVDIDSPPTTWLGDAGLADAEKPLLRMTSKSFPSSAGEGLGVRERNILEIRDGLGLRSDDAEAWRDVGTHWGRDLKLELSRKKKQAETGGLAYARALALEVLANGRPLNFLTLKQFRDVEDPTIACFQALVLTRRTIDRIDDIREIEGRLYARICDQASQPIVSTLGLQPKAVLDTREGRVHLVEPVRPFWMKVGMKEMLGTTLSRRYWEPEWQDDADIVEKRLPFYFAEPKKGAPPPKSLDGAELEREIQDGVPRQLRAKVLAKLDQADPAVAPTPGPPLLDQQLAKRVVKDFEPQTILESILSKEWEDWGTPRWGTEKERILKEVRDAAAGAAEAKAAREETKVLWLLSEGAALNVNVHPLDHCVDVLERWDDGWRQALVALLKGQDVSTLPPDLVKKIVEVGDDGMGWILEGLSGAGLGLGGILRERATPGSRGQARPSERRLREIGEQPSDKDLLALGIVKPQVNALRDLAVWLHLDLGKALEFLPYSQRGSRYEPAFLDHDQLWALLWVGSDGAVDADCLDLTELADLVKTGQQVDLGPILTWLTDAQLDVARLDLRDLGRSIRWLSGLGMREKPPPATGDAGAALFDAGQDKAQFRTPRTPDPPASRADLLPAALAPFFQVDLDKVLALIDRLERKDGEALMSIWKTDLPLPFGTTPLIEAFLGQIGVGEVPRGMVVGAVATLRALGVTTMGELQKKLRFIVAAARVLDDPDKRDRIAEQAVSLAMRGPKLHYQEHRDTVITQISKSAQKEDFCVRCDSIQTAAQAVTFAEAERWSKDPAWYVGPADKATKP